MEYLWIVFYIYLFILFIKQRPKSHYRGVGAHQRLRKREEGKKKWFGTEGEIIHPNPVNLCAYGDRRREQETEGRTKERNRERIPNPATWTIWSPNTTLMGHTVYLF